MAHLNHGWCLHSRQAKDSRWWAGPKGSGSWSLQRLPKKEASGTPWSDYQQHLYRLLGPEKAFYFLHPSTVDKPVSLRVRHLLEAGIDMGAEELWRALHEEPKHQRQIAEAKKGRSLSQQVCYCL
ncbi:uncharacterized protein LOC128347073 isoform X4 [Hemicordylus capensis]|uniref:uncharacterized protein LOC128347073 isoform X4 n=1 Tax=Hemicordylus capensis TaxID=884348 RepID=UPI002302585E|nr:uncharacterized protein LOC128347073 isoform X4 [Hemicordylus capensis]